MITAGIDVGSRKTKVVLMEDGSRIIAMNSAPTGFDFEKAASQLYQNTLTSAGLDANDVSYITATGFGRYRISFRDINVTDITANARGAKFLYSNTACILDVGAGNSRAAKVDERGKVLKFSSTQKCAAGGGGFLEKIAYYTEVDLSQLGHIALKSSKPVEISTVCSVFAESEVINLMTQEVPIEDILMGAHLSIVGRVFVTLKQVGVEPEVTLTGGLVHNPAFVKALRDKLGMKLNAAPELFYAGAVGAAILGYKRLMKKTPSQTYGG